jgi:hypothetical protein
VRLQHGRSEGLYRALLQVGNPALVCSFFVTLMKNYGLQTVFPPQLVPPAPPSAWAAGTTTILKNIRAAAATSSKRFTFVFSLWFKNEA